MSDQLKIQAAVEMSTESAEGALDRVGDAAAQMAGRLQREGAKAGAAVDGIGSGAEKSADQFSRAEGRMAASIKRATANLETLGKTASEKLEWQINQKGLDASKFEPALAKLRELEAANTRVGLSAAQMTNNLRMVPAQMTDIVTSLASGQQPMTVLLQQGGQLKDMFGGVGAAARAVGGYIAGMINPVTVTAAAVGGLGYAFYAASSEADEFKKNLILTGNTTGLTVDKFNQLTAALDGLEGVTRGGAAEALTAMAASGNISADAIGRLTASALKLERAGGPAVADTVKQFEELGKAPVDASLKLNETTRYLTTAVYEQIKALEDQGKTSEAAAVAQKAWADAIDQRTPKMVENLGHIEKAWKGVKEAVAEAIDAAKDWGRVATPSERAAALHTQIGEIEKQLQSTVHAATRINLQNQRQKLVAELQGLYVEIRKTHKEESEKTAAEAREQQRLNATAGVDELIKSQRSKRQQYVEELEKLNKWRAGEVSAAQNNAEALLKVEEKFRQAKVALAKKYEERERAVPKARKSDAEREAEREAARMAKLDAEEEARRVASIQRTAAAMAKETDAIWSRVEAEIEAAATIGMSKTAIEERTLARMQEQLAWRESLNLQDEETEQIKRNIAAQKALVAASGETASKQQAAETAKAALDAQRKAAEAAAAEWQKTVDRIDQTFHDGFVGMLEKGKADWESFADSIANTFKTAVADEIYKMTIRPLVVQVVGAFSGQPGVAGQAQGIGGVISNVQSAYAGVSGGISNAANSFATSGMGQWAGLSTTYGAGYTMGPPTAAGAYGYTAGGTALTSSGSSFVASAAPYAAAIAALAYGDHLMKAGWGLDNNRKGYAASAAGAVAGGVAAGASAGASAGSSVGPVGTVVGAVVGAIAVPVLDRLFGHNNKTNADAAGIQGTFDLSGFSGEQWQQFSKKGGTFRSDKRWTDTYDVSSDIDKELDSAFSKTVAKLQEMGKTLGVETSKSIEGFTHEFSLQLSDNGDMSKAGEKLAGEITRAADELVSRMVPNVDEFARLGETASQTFSRLNQEVAATDAILLAMGKNAAEAFGGVGLASIAARENLIDLAGGLDQLANKTQSFYANFYSSEEQLTLAAKQAQGVLDTGFAELNLTLPSTREAFRALVESQDLSSEAGRKLFNSLLDLADEFDTVADASDAAGEKTKATREKNEKTAKDALSSTASIFDTFATDSQKLAAAQNLVSETFASIGKSVPENAAAFLSLAQSIDPATEAGQGLIAALTKVSNAFAYTQTAAITAAEAATAAINKARNTSAQAFFQQVDFRSAADGYVNDGQAAIDKLFGNINAGAIESAQLAASAAADASQAWKSASQSIKSALDNIRTGSLSGLSPESRYRMLQSQFAATSAAAQSGDKEAAGKLGQIATDFLEASRDYNASSEAFQADRAAADTALSKSLSYASAQVSMQDTIAKASQASVTHLQSLNDTLTGFSAKALELLQKSYGGADRGTASNAVSALSSLQAVADKFFADTTAGFTQQYAGGTLMRLEGSNAQFTDAGGKTSYVRAGESVLDIAKRVDALRDFWSKQFGLNLPSYAVGTPFVPEDQIAQIHQGEMIIPASAAAQLRKYGIGSQPDNGLQAEILAELRTTRQIQQQSYGAMQQQLASSNAKLAAVERRLAAMEDQARLQRAGS